jgi:hypothetical protein
LKSNQPTGWLPAEKKFATIKMGSGATIPNFTCGSYPLEEWIPKTVFYISRLKTLLYSITSNNPLPKTPVGQEGVLQGLGLEGKTWKDVIKFDIPGWTAPKDYTYTIAKSGTNSLRATLIPNHDAYPEKTITLRVNFKDPNWNEIVIADISDKIYRVEADESMGAVGGVTSQASAVVESLAPFLGFAFPAFGGAITNFLIVKNQFR